MIFELPREQVLANIHSNRERHVTELEEALSGWRRDLIEAIDTQRAELTALRKRARAGTLRPRELQHDILGIRSPESHETDYDVAIGMLEMASADLVELSESDFARYVHDQWDWRSRFDEYLEEVRFKGRYTRPSRRRA